MVEHKQCGYTKSFMHIRVSYYKYLSVKPFWYIINENRTTLEKMLFLKYLLYIIEIICNLNLKPYYFIFPC